MIDLQMSIYCGFEKYNKLFVQYAEKNSTFVRLQQVIHNILIIFASIYNIYCGFNDKISFLPVGKKILNFT